MLNTVNNIYATWFYLGYIRKAPGTWGSIGGLGFIYLLSYGWELLFDHYMNINIYLFVTIILFIFGVLSSARFDAASGSHDSKMIVIDEVVGMMITCLPMAILSASHNAPLGFGGLIQPLLALGLFRFFDILKPWPISYIDKHIKGGLGVMLDDVLAGVMAALVFTAIGYGVHAYLL